MTDTLYAGYIFKPGEMESILKFHAEKYGTPPAILPEPLEVEVNKVDLESITLPEGMNCVVSAEKFILPRHMFIKLADLKIGEEDGRN